MPNNNRLELLGTPTSDGYALAINHFSDRVVIMQGDCVLHETRLKDNWIEYPKGTFFRPLQWIAPDRLQFFQDGYWGAMNPEGIVTIPPVFKFIVPFKTTGYFIVKDQHDKCGCVDNDFKMLYPCEYEYKELRTKLIDEFQNNA